MTARSWSLVAVIVACGCATSRTPPLDESAVLRLPADERVALDTPRAQVADADRRVTIAADLRDEARAFVKAAAEQDQRRTGALPALVGDTGTRAQALEANDKLAYARRLLVAREAELAEARARLELAQAILRRAEAQALARQRSGPSLRDRDFAAAETRAARRVEKSARMAALRSAEADELRLAWERRHQLARALEPSPRPAPPPIPPPVNDGPVAPQSVPDPSFAR